MLSEFESKEAKKQTQVMNSMKNKNRKASISILEKLTETPILLQNHQVQFGSRRHSRTGITTQDSSLIDKYLPNLRSSTSQDKR